MYRVMIFLNITHIFHIDSKQNYEVAFIEKNTCKKHAFIHVCVPSHESRIRKFGDSCYCVPNETDFNLGALMLPQILYMKHTSHVVIFWWLYQEYWVYFISGYWYMPALLYLFLSYVIAVMPSHFSQCSRYEAGVMLRAPLVSRISLEATTNWVRPKKSFCYFKGGIFLA